MNRDLVTSQAHIGRFSWVSRGRRGARASLPFSVVALLPLLHGCLPDNDGHGDPFPDEEDDAPAEFDMSQFNLYAPGDPSDPVDDFGLDELEFGDWLEVTAFYPNQANRLWLSNDGDGVRDESGYQDDPSGGGHGGATAFATGDPTGCWNCHQDPEFDHGGISPQAPSNPFDMSVDLVDRAGDPYSKDDTKALAVRAAKDDDYLYLHAQWESQTDASGRGEIEPGPNITHQTYRWDGEESEFDLRGEQRQAGPHEAGPVVVEDLAEEGRFDYEERFVAMSAPAHNPVTDEFDGGESGNFNAHGCFMACHDDLRNMPNAHEPEAAETLLEGQSDMRHYTLNSRNLDGQDVDDYDVPEELAERYEDGNTAELAESLEGGAFLDLFQARMARSAPMGHASADYIYHYREGNNALVGDEDGFADAGDNNWRNQDPDDDDEVEDGYLRYIYDPRETGFWGLDEDDRAEQKRQGAGPLIVDEDSPYYNAIDLADNDGPFEWEEGREDYVLQEDVGEHGEDGDALSDLLDAGTLVPRRVLQDADGAQSTVRAFAHWEETSDNRGVFNVVVVRPLNPEDYGDINGQVTDPNYTEAFDEAGMTMGFGLHDDHVGNRSHFVTFPVGLVPEGSRSEYAEAVEDLYDSDAGALQEALPIIEAVRN